MDQWPGGHEELAFSLDTVLIASLSSSSLRAVGSADLRKSANKDTSPVMPSWVDHQRVWVCMQLGNTSCTFKFQPRLPNEASWLVYEVSRDHEGAFYKKEYPNTKKELEINNVMGWIQFIHYTCDGMESSQSSQDLWLDQGYLGCSKCLCHLGRLSFYRLQTALLEDQATFVRN